MGRHEQLYYRLYFHYHNQCSLSVWRSEELLFCLSIPFKVITPELMQIWPLVHCGVAIDVCYLKSSELHHWFNLRGRAASDQNAQRKLAASTLQRPALPLDFACSIEKEKGGKDKKHPFYAVCGLHTTVKLRHQHKDKTLCVCVCLCVCVF